MASWSPDHHGLVILKHPVMNAVISAWGGQLIQWQPASEASSLIWLSPDAVLPTDARLARLPKLSVVACQFAGHGLPTNFLRAAHGLVRSAWWQLHKLQELPDPDKDQQSAGTYGR